MRLRYCIAGARPGHCVLFGLPCGVQCGVLVGVVGGLPWLGLLAAYVLCCDAVFCLYWLGFVCVWLAFDPDFIFGCAGGVVWAHIVI
jgi:hypothetical protein